MELKYVGGRDSITVVTGEGVVQVERGGTVSIDDKTATNLLRSDRWETAVKKKKTAKSADEATEQKGN